LESAKSLEAAKKLKTPVQLGIQGIADHELCIMRRMWWVKDIWPVKLFLGKLVVVMRLELCMYQRSSLPHCHLRHLLLH